MVLVILPVLVLALYGAKFTGKGIRPDYISRESTQAVKGIFVLLVFLRHYKSCVSLTGALDRPFLKLNNWLGQLIVVLFFFYSGYGVYTSYRKKGVDYAKAIPKKRVLTTLVHFDLAVCVYLLADALMGIRYSGEWIVSAFFAWQSVGNSNWFIWAILVLYLMSWAVLRFLPAGAWQPAALTAMSLLYVILFHRAYPDSWWWYDTIFCYAVGMWYGLFREKIEESLSKERNFWVVFALLLAAGRFLFYWRNHLAAYEALAVVFCLLCVMVTMKVSFGNRVLRWLGERVFPFYIIQRLPMMILSHFGINEKPYLFFALSLPLTLLCGVGFDWCVKRLDGAFLNRKK